MVGASRFERPTSCSQGRRATRLRHAPTPALSDTYRTVRKSSAGRPTFCHRFPRASSRLARGAPSCRTRFGTYQREVFHRIERPQKELALDAFGLQLDHLSILRRIAEPRVVSSSHWPHAGPRSPCCQDEHRDQPARSRPGPNSFRSSPGMLSHAETPRSGKPETWRGSGRRSSADVARRGVGSVAKGRSELLRPVCHGACSK